ncbi:MAG: hypothetical protein UY92_C0007G0025 [Candidatus Magasanikbacteria bacterium GW2011_GWA2_56_11]|uniref:EamA domain-containing protein n=1 Tax=Candidatus Magasanikbacteria bacterium GW2011_GWA2_56_11 TaxID=1619044 RepID=A0A0G1YGM1_9BACT|nr:MAG: hypothetical protein UY92_C0007G0025 [Candidatus Magasanikbacteria bacterium GW2011_GWA2_56_11]
MLFILIITGAVALAGHVILNARYVRAGAAGGWSSTFVLGVSKVSAALLMLAVWLVLLFQGRATFPTSWAFWGAFLVTVVLNIIFEIIRFRSYALAPIALTSPFGAISPVLTILPAWLFLRELPSFWGGLGIGLITVSIYALHTQSGWNIRNFFAPFRAVWKDRGTRYAFLSSLPPAITIVFDKKAVVASDPITFSLLAVAAIGITAWIVDFAYRGRERFFSSVRQCGWGRFLKIGFLYLVANLAFNMAFLFAIVPYVSALRRTVIIFEVLFAYFFLQEKTDIVKRAAVSIGVVLGTILIGLAR